MTTSSRFYDSTPQRTFRIICDGHELYANGGYLAAMSNYFQTICDGQYIESLNRTVKLPDVPVSEMVEFLDYACPNDESCERERQITEKNIVVIYTLADRFLFPSIRKEVEWFIKQRIHLQNSFSIDTLLDLVMLMKDNLFDKTVKPKLFHKLAIFGVEAVGKVLKERADIVDQEFILKTMGEHVDFWTGRARDMGWGIWDFVLGYISLEVRTISFDPNVPCGVWSCGVARIDAESGHKFCPALEAMPSVSQAKKPKTANKTKKGKKNYSKKAKNNRSPQHRRFSARGKGSRVGNHRK